MVHVRMRRIPDVELEEAQRFSHRDPERAATILYELVTAIRALECIWKRGNHAEAIRDLVTIAQSGATEIRAKGARGI